MASLRDLFRKFRGGIEAFTDPLDDPIEIKVPKNKQTPRVRRAMKQSRPLVREAKKKTRQARPTNVIRNAPKTLPRISAANRIKNPVGRIAGQAAQEVANAPRDVFAGGLATGSNIADLLSGKRVRPQKAIGDIASIGKGFANVYAPKGAGSIAARVGRRPLRELAKQGARQGASIGGATGLFYGLEGGRDKDLGSQVKSGLKEGAIGTVGGAAIGTATPFASRAGKNAFEFLKQGGKLRPDIERDLADFYRRKITTVPGSKSVPQDFDEARDFAIASLENFDPQGVVKRGRINDELLSEALELPEKLKKNPSDRKALNSALELIQIIKTQESSLARQSGKIDFGEVGKSFSDDPKKGRVFKKGKTQLPSQVSKKGRIEVPEEAFDDSISSRTSQSPEMQTSKQAQLQGQGGQLKATQQGPSILDQQQSGRLQRFLSSRSSNDSIADPVTVAKGEAVDLDDAVIRKRNQLLKEIQSPQRAKTAGEAKNLGDLRALGEEGSNIDVRSKAKITDKLSTPAEVYKRFGLEKEAEALRLSELKTKREIPSHIAKVQEWLQRIGPKERQEAVFDFLDGQKVSLTESEKQVADEIRTYLSTWADRLELPEDKRVTNYITRLFDDELIQKEFDPDLAKLIEGEVPGSVFNPFMQQRKGAPNYKRDLGLALEVYAKRAARKANMDPVLDVIKKRSDDLELSQLKFIQNNLERINLRPTDFDNLVDNFVKSTPIGYKLGQRPVNIASSAIRRWGYRGTLGGNLGSSLKNLTQGANTYAKLGEKYTLQGYVRALKPGARRELERVGVLDNSFIQDRSLSATKKLLQKMDEGLFYAFQKAEQLNRGAAYFGAKKKALDAGKSMDEAILEGLETARETQFTFGNVDTPEILSSDVGKLIGQFQSFNLKQAEFLKNMIKNKEWSGLMRWIGANAVLAGTLGNIINFDLIDAVPFSGIPEGRTKIGQTPFIRAVSTGTKAAVGAEGEYGQPITATDFADDAATALVPGYIQGKKTFQGLQSIGNQASTSASGRVRYPIENDPISKFRTAVFGQYSGNIARFYFDEALTPLGDKDTATFQKYVQQGYDPVKVWKALYKRRVKRSFERKYNEIKKDKTLTREQKAEAARKSLQDGRRLLRELDQF